MPLRRECEAAAEDGVAYVPVDEGRNEMLGEVLRRAQTRRPLQAAVKQPNRMALAQLMAYAAVRPIGLTSRPQQTGATSTE